MTNNIRHLTLILFGILLVGFSSCRTKQLGGQTMKKEKELRQALELHNQEFEWFSAKGKLQYKNVDDSGRATIHVRMKKDSIIWISLKKFSVEISRVKMTPDSIYIVYRWEGLYEKGRLEQFTRAYNTNFDFAEIQELFFGNVTNTKNAEFVSRDSLKYHLTAVKDDITYDYHINPFNLLLDKFYARDKSQREVIGKYGDYKKHDDGNQFSYLREYTFKEGSEVTYLAIDYSDVEIDVPKKIKFSIPSHYEEFTMY